MAIVALVVAGLFTWLGLSDRYAPQQRRFALGVAVVGAGFAVYLMVYNPADAWDLRWVGRMISHLGGHAVREIMR